MDGIWQDLRFGIRTLRARPGFTLVVVATLALGVGANTAIFSAINALLLRPLPVADVDRLVYGAALREGYDPFGTSLLDYELYRAEARGLASVGLGTPRTFTLLGRGEPEHLRAAAVTASYLPTLGVGPALGRAFTGAEDRPGGPAVALLGHDLWQRRFGGDRGVLGRPLSLEGTSYTVIGVLPRGFDMPYAAEVWVPLQADIAALPLDQRAATAHELVARLAPGIGREQAGAELKRLAARLERDYPQIRRGWSYGIVPLRRLLLSDLTGRTQRSLLALSLGVGFLLLLCCANVAGLLLARGLARQGELATRLALGAGRGRLTRQLLTESLLLALLGGALGVLLAAWMGPLLRALSPIQALVLGAYLTDFRLDGRVLSFAAAITVADAALFGLLPALGLARSATPASSLAEGARRTGAGAGSRRAMAALVVGEVAMATTLLVGGGLMLRSFQRLHALELGFRPDGLLAVELPLSRQHYPDRDRQVLFMERLLERVRALPGVTAAGVTLNVPMQRGITIDTVFAVEGQPPPPPDRVPITAHRPVSPGYLETLGVELLEGRLLDSRDRAGALPVVVVSEELVRQAWPEGDALGKRLCRVRAGVRGPWMTVVGVVADVKEDRFGFRVARPVWYVPYAQEPFPAPSGMPLELVVRAGEAPGAAATVRRAVHAVDPSQPVASVLPMREYLADVLIAERFGAVLMGTLAGFGLLLAGIGLYGLMAYVVGQRRREMGLRIALGARPAVLLRRVVADGAALVALGLALGTVAAWGLARMLAGSLYEVRPGDPATFAGAALAIAAVGLLACALPARRAARVDPMVALRRD